MTKKPFSPIGCTINYEFDRFLTILRQLYKGLGIIWRQPDEYCLMTAWQLTDRGYQNSDNLQYNTLGRWVDRLIDQASDGSSIILIDWK